VTPLALHDVVPLHVPVAPLSLDHVTDVTPTLSVAIPERLSVELFVDQVAPFVGDVIVTVGAVVSGTV
jgi:hypothetical protein